MPGLSAKPKPASISALSSVGGTPVTDADGGKGERCL